MALLALTLPLGIVVALVAAAVVYADATRRSLSPATRLSWTVGAGVVGVCGFVVPSLFSDAFHRAYFEGLKSRAVAVSPYEVLLLHLVVGVGAAALFVFLYGVGSRHGLTAE